MSRHIRAKFSVNEVADVNQRTAVNPSATTGDPDYGKWKIGKVHERVTLNAVYESGAPTAENVRFAKATPNGRIEMTIDNPDAWGIFVPGDQVYVDFSPAPITCTACYGQGRKYETVNGKSTFVECPRCKGSGIDPEQPGQ